MPSAPSGPQQDITKVWLRTWIAVSKDIDEFAALILDGGMPLTAGERRRLQSLMNGVAALRTMTPAGEQTAAYLWDKIAKASDEAQAIADKAMLPWAMSSAESASSLIAGGFDMVNERAIRAVTSEVTGMMSKDFAQMTLAAQERMVADLVMSIAAGDGARDLAKRISKSIEPAFGTAQSRSLRIARTQLSRAYDLSRFEVYAEAAAQGVVTGWEWVANGANPCDVCQALDGTVWPVGEDTYRHPNCVCSTVPVLADSPQAQVPWGEKSVDRYDGADPRALYRETSKSGWTHWKVGEKRSGLPKPLYDNPVSSGHGGAAPVKAPAPVKPLDKKAEFLGSGDSPFGYTKGTYGGEEYHYNFAKGKWVHTKTGTIARSDAQAALMQATKNRTGSTKPMTQAQKKAVKGDVNWMSPNMLAGDIDGYEFYWHPVKGKWLEKDTHKPVPQKVKKKLDKAKEAGKKAQASGDIDLDAPYADAPVTTLAEPMGVGDTVTVPVGENGADVEFTWTGTKWESQGGFGLYGAEHQLATDTFLGKIKPVSTGAKTGQAMGKAGSCTVKYVDDDHITATYGGADFHWDGQKWVHGPTGTAAGPNSKIALDAAVKDGKITLPSYKPKVKGLPEYVSQDTAAAFTPDDLARGAAKKAADRHGSPVAGVSEAEWRKAWDDASDGHQLPAAITNDPASRSLVEGFRRYTSDYVKHWSGNPLARKWFESAPMYVSTTYRGMRLRSVEAVMKYAEDFPPGSLLDTRDGWSMSFSESVARGFGGHSGGSSVMIEVRGGTSGLPVRGFSHFSSESEILVNSQLRVVEMHYTDTGLHVICEEVGKYGGTS